MSEFVLIGLSGMSVYEKQEIYYMTRQFLGAPVVGVELRDSQIDVALQQGIREYSTFINQWALENRMGQMLGLPKDIDFTLKYVSNNFTFEQTFARAYSEQAGLSSNGIRHFKQDYFILTAGTQIYNLPANREINEILWYTPGFTNLYGLDAYSNSNLAYSEFGASFQGSSLYAVMPVFDTLLSSQAAEVRNKVRGSEYSYTITAGPDGTKNVRLYPVPRASGSTNIGYNMSPGSYSPGVVFYRYYDTAGVAGNASFSGFTANPGYTGSSIYTQGNGLVSGPSDARLDWLTYAELNTNSKWWVQQFALAICMRILGLNIRGKFNGKLPIPDAELEMNASSLDTAADKEMDRLRTTLKERLEKLGYKQLLENNASMQESINKTLGYNFSPIFLG